MKPSDRHAAPTSPKRVSAPPVYWPHLRSNPLQARAAGAPPAHPTPPPAPRPQPRLPAPPRVPVQRHPGAVQRATELTTFHPPDLPRTRLEGKVREVRSSRVTDRGFFAPHTTQQKVDILFAEFTGMGFGYSLGIGGADSVLGTQLSTPLRSGERMRDAFGGNCIAFSNAFAEVLNAAGVKAEARVVRREEAGRAFVVYAPRFIDREVQGNIYKEGILWQSHYLFSNHMATWVKELNIYYDTMAGVAYRDIATHVVMELNATDDSGNEFTGTYSARTWNLRRRDEILPGQFSRFDMTPTG